VSRFNLALDLNCNLRNLIRISVTQGVTICDGINESDASI
jgi:hypothetical protein